MTGPVVAVIGGGQLARMLAEAASPLGIHLRVLAAPSDEGADQVVTDVVVGAPDDVDAITHVAAGADVVTFDHENVDHDALDALERSGVAVWPSVATLRFSDKAHQRRSFAAAGLPVPDFEVLDDPSDAVERAAAFAARHDHVVIKASRGGYDGRGVWMRRGDEVAEFVADWDGAPLVLEPRLPLLGEVAVLIARRPSGDVVAWPVVETVQVDGMCDEVVLPAELDPAVAERAVAVATEVARVTGAVGVMAIELFLVDAEDGIGIDVIVNEVAPRVHNSGHLTIDACATSQFEQHLRAVLDWPLGPTDPVAAAATMVNVVGAEGCDPRDRQAEALAAVPEAKVHLYGKAARAGRKIGHVTVTGPDRSVTRARARRAADLLAGSD